MILTTDQLHGLNGALEESNLLGIEVDPDRRIAAATFFVLILPEIGEPPPDRRFQFVFWPVGRVAASLRNGLWLDKRAPAVRFDVTDLLRVVQSFDGLPIHGHQFFDVPESKNFERWADRLSLDYSGVPGTFSHTLDLFQDGGSRNLDIRLWFNEFEIRNPADEVVPLERFIAEGQRWWDGLTRGDPRTRGYNIFPLSQALQQPTTTARADSAASHERRVEELVLSLSVRDWEDGMETEDPVKVRKSLMQDIVNSGEVSVAPLLSLLNHSDWAVRDDAALMLGHLSSNRAVEPLLGIMLKDESMSVKLSAASALERIGTPDALAAVRDWYHNAHISAQQRVSQKLSEYLIYGEADSKLMNRAVDLAQRKGVMLHQIITAWWSSNPASLAELKRSGGVSLSPEERDYLAGPYNES